MEYYSSREGFKILSSEDLYTRFSMIIVDFCKRDYFKENLNLTYNALNGDTINRKAKGQIGITIYPFDDWPVYNQTKEHIFDTIEFLFRFVSKPGEYGYKTDLTNWNTKDYLTYDKEAGRLDYMADINALLNAFDKGFELQLDGTILFIGDETLNFIDTDFPEYDDNNIDNVIHSAIKQWKNKTQSLDDKKRAIIKLADVFEYLKKSNVLVTALNTDDSNDLFHIANKFNLRHHNPSQKNNYDKEIWFDWIFQFYLSTCIATLKIINKNKT